MEVQVTVRLAGLRLDPTAPSDRVFSRVTFQDSDGRRVDAIEANVSARTRWRSAKVAADRAGVVILGGLDLVLGWPLGQTFVEVDIDRSRQVRSHDISTLQPYEIGEILSGLPPLPRSVAIVNREALRRAEEIWARALRLRVAELERFLGPFAQVSMAAAGSHPYDRIVPLWSALELLRPFRRDLPRLRAIVGNDEAVAAEEERRAGAVMSDLLAQRRGYATDPWLHDAVKIALSGPVSSATERLFVCAVLAYAIRSKIVHGQWARVRQQRRPEAGRAEQILWQLVQREFELGLFRGRLPPIRAIGATAFSA